MRIWTVDLLKVEIARLKDKRRPGGPWSPWQDTFFFFIAEKIHTYTSNTSTDTDTL